jgi:hypothetical protein
MDGETIAWGRPQGRSVFEKLVSFVEKHPGQLLFKLSMEGVERIDGSFASEAIVELVRRYVGIKGICLTELADDENRFNIDLAARRMNVPVAVWNGGAIEMIGGQPSSGTREALDFVLSRSEARAADFVGVRTNVSIANASTKFKQLWEQGFLMRSESAADSGGVEFLYRRIG